MKAFTLRHALEADDLLVIDDEVHPFIGQEQDTELAALNTSITRIETLAEEIDNAAPSEITPAMAVESYAIAVALEAETDKPEDGKPEGKGSMMKRVWEAIKSGIQKVFAAILAALQAFVNWLFGIGGARRRGLKTEFVKNYEELMYIFKNVGSKAKNMRLDGLIGPTIKADKLHIEWGGKVTPSQGDMIEQGPMTVAIIEVMGMLAGLNPVNSIKRTGEQMHTVYIRLMQEANKLDADSPFFRTAHESNDVVPYTGRGESAPEHDENTRALNKFMAQAEREVKGTYEENSEVLGKMRDLVNTAKEAQEQLGDKAYVFPISFEDVLNNVVALPQRLRFAQVAKKEGEFADALKDSEKAMEKGQKGFDAYMKKNERAVGAEATTHVNRLYMAALVEFLKDLKTAGQAFTIAEFAFQNAIDAAMTTLEYVLAAVRQFIEDHPNPESARLEAEITTPLLDARHKLKLLRATKGR